MCKIKINWKVHPPNADINSVMGVGGQVIVNGKSYRHAIYLHNSSELEKAKQEIEKKLIKMIEYVKQL